jgi:hypothetical protein
MTPIFFTSPANWRAWLADNHSAAKEVYVGCYKTDEGSNNAAFIRHGSPIPMQIYLYRDDILSLSDALQRHAWDTDSKTRRASGPPLGFRQ